MKTYRQLAKQQRYQIKILKIVDGVSKLQRPSRFSTDEKGGVDTAEMTTRCFYQFNG